MDTIYLLPGEERCVDFRDANGVPKVHYTYCSIRGKLFNCTCCTKDEAQRLCEDWLIKQDRCYMNCTPFVRQYGILFRKWGVFVCQRDNESPTELKR